MSGTAQGGGASGTTYPQAREEVGRRYSGDAPMGGGSVAPVRIGRRSDPRGNLAEGEARRPQGGGGGRRLRYEAPGRRRGPSHRLSGMPVGAEAGI